MPVRIAALCSAGAQANSELTRLCHRKEPSISPKQQPLKGLLWLFASALITWIWLAGTSALGIDGFDAGVNWPTAWFFFGYGMLAFFEGWPLASMVKQPWGGLLSASIAWLVSAVGWSVVNKWLGTDGANALFNYAQFFLFTIAWFYHNHPFANLSQPSKGIALFVLSGVLGYVVYLFIGPQPWEYLFVIPQWYFYFFQDWPIPSEKPYQKGTFWAVLVIIGTFATHLAFNALGVPIITPRGMDFFSLLLAGMLVFYAFESWPFASRPQPVQGALLTVASIVVSAVAYPILFSVLRLRDYVLSAWCFAAWCWFPMLAWMLAPWPFEAEA